MTSPAAMQRERAPHRDRAVAGALLIALTSAGIACSTLLGLEDTTLSSADGGDAAMDHVVPADAGALRSGSLDPTFGHGGMVVVPTTSSGRPSVVVDGDDIVVVIPSLHDGTTEVQRFSKEGTLDPLRSAKIRLNTEGVPGHAVVAAPGGDGVLVYSRGYRPDGGTGPNLDLSRVSRVGGIEHLWQPPGGPQDVYAAAALARRPAGSLLVQDGRGRGDAGVVRVRAFRPDGAIDHDFGEGGVVSVETPVGSFRPQDAVGQENGQLVTVGIARGIKGMWLRFKSDGAIDESFGPTGAVGAFDYDDVLATSVIADDAGYAVGGYTWPDNPDGGSGSGESRGILIRLLPNGQLDPSVWDGGIYDFGPASHDEFYVLGFKAMILLPDDAFIALAVVMPLGGSPIAGLLRIRRNGIDPTFGENGLVLIEKADDGPGPRSIALQADGRLLVAWMTLDRTVKLARYVVQ